VRAVRRLVALQLALLAATGIATVARFPYFALVDERAHFAYVQEVAEERRLPYLGRTYISPEAQALDEGIYPAPAREDPRRRGLAGFSYEAFQPPLYYVAAAPVFAAAGADHRVKLRALRVLGLLALLAAAGLLVALAHRVAPPGAGTAVAAVALTYLLWPGVVVRTVTVSNAALELALGAAAALALWEAGRGRSGRWLLAAGALVGLGLLTRLSFAIFVPVLVWVARAYPWRRAAVALALPAVLLAPWVASNLDRYGAPTAGGVVRAMQEDVLNPQGTDYGVADLPGRARSLLNGVLAEEWWSEFLSTPKRRARDVAMLALFAVPAGLALRRGPPPGAWLLAVPLLAGLVLMAAGLLAGNWDFFYPRYLHAALPGFGVLAGLAVRASWPRRGAWAAAGCGTLALTALWAHLSTVTPFVP